VATSESNTQAERAAIRVLALLLHEEPAERDRQFEALNADLPRNWRLELDRSETALQSDDSADRLQVLRDQLPLLGQLAPEQQRLLLDLAKRMSRADGRVSLTEHLFLRMLRDTLQQGLKPHSPSPDDLRWACTLLLSLTARAGQHEETARSAAFHAGVDTAPMDGLGALMEASEFSTRRVDRALDTLAGTTPGFRAELYRAVTTVARHDDQINRAEQELLAAIGLALKIDPSAEPESWPVASATKKPPAVPALTVAASGATGWVDETGWTRHDRVPAIALVVANLVPLVGVLLFAWDVTFLLLLYWLENLVIGAYTLVRMFSTVGITALGRALFFCIHYGFFCAGHGMFVLALSSLGGSEEADSLDFEEGDIPFLIPFYLLRGIFRWIGTHMPELLFIPLLALVISHGISLVRHHFIAREDEGRTLDEIMFDPYPRIVILHVSIIAGAFFVIISGGASTTPVLILVILGKTWLDLYLHRRAHARRQKARLGR